MTSSQGTLHRLQGFGLAGPGRGEWGHQQVLDNWSVTQTAEHFYASIDVLAVAWHAPVATLTNVPEFRVWQQSNPTFKQGSSGRHRARGASLSCTTPARRTASSVLAWQQSSALSLWTNDQFSFPIEIHSFPQNALFPPHSFSRPHILFPAFYVCKASESCADLGQLKRTGSDGRR